MQRKADEVTKLRDELRNKKKEAVSKKNKMHQALKAKTEQVQAAMEKKQDAELQIADVRAHADDQESIDKQMSEWREAHKRAGEVVQASQHAFHESRKEAEDLEVSFLTTDP